MKVGVGKQKLSVDAGEDEEEEIISVRQKVAYTRTSQGFICNTILYYVTMFPK